MEHFKYRKWTALSIIDHDAEYIYSDDLRRIKITRFLNLGGNDEVSNDGLGRSLGQRWRLPGKLWHESRPTYDLAGNISRIRNELAVANHRDKSYAYDELNRLQNFQLGTFKAAPNTDQPMWQTSQIQGWSYDQTDNQIRHAVLQKNESTHQLQGTIQFRRHNALNQIVGITNVGTAKSVVPKYDAVGNMTRMPQPNDPTKAFDCTYDAWNRLVRVKDGRKVIAEYEYDALHRRIKTTRPEQGLETTHDYDVQNRVIEETTRCSQGADCDKPAITRQYIWGIDGRLAAIDVYDYDTRTFVKRFLAIPDQLRSTMALFSLKNLNTVEKFEYRIDYDPYGKPIKLNEDFSVADDQWTEEDPFPHLFAGYRYDAETGLYHTHYRQYHPTLGVWTSPDPEDNLPNLYAYVGNDPVNRIDPLGADWTHAVEWGFENIVDPFDALFAGFADTITFGGSTKARAAMYGDWATQNHEGAAFVGGQVTGIAVSFALGYGSAGQTANLARGAWALRTAQLYTSAGTAYGIGHSSYNVATGQATAWDALSFLPAAGFAVRIRSGSVSSVFRSRVASGKMGFREFRSVNSGRYGTLPQIRTAYNQYLAGNVGDFLTRPAGLFTRLARVVYDNRSWNYVRSQRNLGLLTHRGRNWTWEHMFLKQRFVNQNVPSIRRGFTNGYVNTFMRMTRSQNSAIRATRADRIFKAKTFGYVAAAGTGGYLAGDSLSDYILHALQTNEK